MSEKNVWAFFYPENISILKHNGQTIRSKNIAETIGNTSGSISK